jgi:hypothetical protein
MIFRLSRKLCTKLKIGKLPALPLDNNPYADWSCHLFTADHRQYIIMCNTASLYSCLRHGKGITSGSKFIERALSTIRDFMEDDGQTFVYERSIEPSSDVVQFAEALDRSVTGSMNDLIQHAKYWLAEGEVSPHDVGFKLNDILLSALATEKSQGYGKPNEAFKAMLGSQPATEREEQ